MTVPKFEEVDGKVCVHATTVAWGGVALAIMGPSGSGKSGTAAGMIAAGGQLISDDLTVFTRCRSGILAHAPPGTRPAIDLRGLGIVSIDRVNQARLVGILILEHSLGRFPDPETLDILSHPVCLLRHPTTADLSAKAGLWLRSQLV